ncbi:unnamed protein product [Anisakis simplex]|uniref:RING-type domain-containing protein n=1 Tax=Anisakis simplex TaxID=6269 RepID=A0A0M3JZ76_ANISI|nr:unnamed protein product [Anisakis simplex]
MNPATQRRVLISEGGGELTEDEMAGLISNDESEQQTERVTHLVDNDLNYTTIPLEVLEAAGIDVDNVGELSEEQMSTMLALASSASAQHHLSTTSQRANQRIPPPSSHKRSASPVVHSDPVDNLTMVISEDGSLKLTDSAQQNFFFSAEQLAAHNIDVNNLTDESIQQIVQLAMPSLDMGKTAEQKRRKLDANATVVSSAQLSYSTALSQSSFQMDAQSSSSIPAAKVAALPSQSGTFLTLDSMRGQPLLTFSDDHNRVDQLALIGEEVEVKKNGKNVPATIRYCRHSGGYKVQFADGHFEWVTQDQIQLIGGTKNRSDHESYSGSSEMEMTRTNAIGSSGVGRRAPPAIPGIKVTPSNGFEKEGEPNFCCVICDRKVYQKEPQYIVIRVPACDACTEKKIMVLDTGTEERGIQCSPSPFELTDQTGADRVVEQIQTCENVMPNQTLKQRSQSNIIDTAERSASLIDFASPQIVPLNNNMPHLNDSDHNS